MAWTAIGYDENTGMVRWYQDGAEKFMPAGEDPNPAPNLYGWDPNMAMPAGGFTVGQALAPNYLSQGTTLDDPAALAAAVRDVAPGYTGPLDMNAVIPPSAMRAPAKDNGFESLLGMGAMAGLGYLSGGFGLGDLWSSLSNTFNPPTFSGSFNPTLPAVEQIASGSMPTQVGGWYGEAPNLDPSGIWSGNYTPPGETLLSEMAGGAPTAGQVTPSAWYPGSTGLPSSGWSMPNLGLNDIMKYAGPLASLAGGVMGSGAAKDAANTQANAAREAIAAQMAMYGQTRADLEPYRVAGAGALGQLRDYTATPNSLLMKPFGMDDFYKSPAYEFNLSEGMRALNHGAAARQQYYAPATLKSLGDFAQGRASNEFQNAFSNYQTNMGNIWNRLSGLAGMGQNASAQMGSLGANVASNVGNNITGIGNAQAAGQVGGANAISGGISNAYNAYLMDQILSKNQSSMYGKA